MKDNLFKNRHFKPMLLSEVHKPFDDPKYLFEIKYDGIRALIFASPKEVTIKSRNQYDITYLYPELQAIKNIVKKNCIFDGEIICLEDGLPNFLALQKRAHLKQKEKIQEQSLLNPAYFICFDIIYESRDLRNKKLIIRKEILNQYPDNEVFIKSKYFLTNGKKMFQFVKKHHLEGIVAKHIDSQYEINIRTPNWLKIKNFQEQNFYIVGYENKKGAITLYVAEKEKEQYFYAGKVLLYENNPAYSKIKEAKKQKYKVHNLNHKIIQIAPIYQATIIFLERTKGGNLRHPVFKELTCNSPLL